MYNSNLFQNDPLPNLIKDTIKTLLIIAIRACPPDKLLNRIKRIEL
jgi:hypothetical protein